MFTKVQAVLTRIKHEKYLQRFQEQEFDDECLNKLTETQLLAFLPAGVVSKFIPAYESEKTDAQQTVQKAYSLPKNKLDDGDVLDLLLSKSIQSASSEYSFEDETNPNTNELISKRGKHESPRKQYRPRKLLYSPVSPRTSANQCDFDTEIVMFDSDIPMKTAKISVLQNPQNEEILNGSSTKKNRADEPYSIQNDSTVIANFPVFSTPQNDDYSLNQIENILYTSSTSTCDVNVIQMSVPPVTTPPVVPTPKTITPPPVVLTPKTITPPPVVPPPKTIIPPSVPMNEESSVDEPEGVSENKTMIISTAAQLEQLLNSSARGKAILLNYQKNDSGLSTSDSLMLCQIVLRAELGDNPAILNLVKKDFLRLRQCIKELFPAEKAETYYVAPIYKKCSARGRLLNKYEKLRGILIKSGVITGRRASASKASQAQTAESAEPTGNTLKLIEWLQTNLGPLPTLIEIWILTQQHRLVTERSPANAKEIGTVSDYLDKYPALKVEESGIRMVEVDFEYLHPSKGDFFHKQWSHVASAIVDLVLASGNKYDDIVALSGADIFTNDPEVRKVAAILILPFLFPCPGDINFGRKGAEAWKPSKVESAQGFLLKVPSQAMVEITLQRKREFSYKKKQPSQPRSVIVGEGTKPSQVFVTVNDLKYHFKTPPEAIDWCFKLFFSLDCAYPAECQQVYFFLQRYVYKVETPFDKNFIAVHDLAKMLKLQ